MAAPSPPTEATPTELVLWAFDRLNEHDVASIRRFWTEATVEDFPTGVVTGQQAIAEYFQSVFDALEGFHLQVVKAVGDETDVFVHWHLTGRHTAEFMGVAATGKPIDLHGMDHFVIRDGVVVHNTVRYDQLDFARQLGMMPADGSAPDRAMKKLFNARTRAAGLLSRRR